jgi:hypothetical protein
MPHLANNFRFCHSAFNSRTPQVATQTFTCPPVALDVIANSLDFHPYDFGQRIGGQPLTLQFEDGFQATKSAEQGTADVMLPRRHD